MMRLTVFITLVLAIFILTALIAPFLAFSETSFRGLGIVFIGPIPIIIDTSDPRTIPLLFIPVIIVAAVFFLLSLRVRKRVG